MISRVAVSGAARALDEASANASGGRSTRV
jgi:hypothetical protein